MDSIEIYSLVDGIAARTIAGEDVMDVVREVTADLTWEEVVDMASYLTDQGDIALADTLLTA